MISYQSLLLSTIVLNDIQGVAIMCREYTYFWPTVNGALVAEMSPNSFFWYLFFKFSWGACPQTP